MTKRIFSLLLALVFVLALLPAGAGAANDKVELTITVRDFKADGVLFEGGMASGEGLVQSRLGADKKPVYNLSLWQELFGETVSQANLDAFFNDVPGVNLKTTKTLTMLPDGDEPGYWTIDSSYDPKTDEWLDGFFPIDNELFGNEYEWEGETYDDGHNFPFSVEIHTRFKYVEGATFEFSGDDDVWVFFNNRLAIDLGGVHGEQDAFVALDEVAQDFGIRPGDIVSFDMFYMERHTTGSNMRIRTNFDFLNLNASAWALEELAEADALGLIPDALREADLTKPITRAEFAAVSVKVFEALTFTKATPASPNPFTDTNDPEVLKALGVGITNGMSATTFEPDRLLNREQAATMLTRVFKKVNLSGWTLETDGSFNEQFKTMFTMPELFGDDAYISSWAKDSVYFMAANGIIKGMGSDENGKPTFAPRDVTESQKAIGYANATRQQALLIAVRMVKNLG